MTDEIEKHRKEKMRSEELFRRVDRSAEHFKEAAEKLIAAEKHIEKAEKGAQATDIALRETEKKLAATEKAIIQVHRDIKKDKEQEPEKTKEPAGGSPPAKKQ